VSGDSRAWRPEVTMANFRAERLFIRVAGSIDGFDPNEGIDAEEFAFLMVCDQQTYDRTPLSQFTFAPFDRPRWFPASEGLASVRDHIADLEAKRNRADDESKALIDKQIETLRAVEDRLDRIDTHDLKFHFLARDLD
jgi:hypothetical protein